MVIRTRNGVYEVARKKKKLILGITCLIVKAKHTKGRAIRLKNTYIPISEIEVIKLENGK